MIGDRALVERRALHNLRVFALVCIAIVLIQAPWPECATAEQLPVEAGCLVPEQLLHDGPLEDAPRTAWWPFSSPRRPPIYESDPCNVTPHPAVARIVVPEGGMTAYGSGT